MPLVNAGLDKTINVGNSVELDAVVSNDVTTINWSPTGDIFRNTREGITVKPTQNTAYTVEVKNAGGCVARDRVNVFVICNGNNVFVPNLFSPNDDGANDIFYPRGTGIFRIKSMRIFNRWGEAVFEKSSFNSNDAAAGWDGKYKGTKLNADVYVYILELICDNNSILSFKGNVTLVR
jgi:gliding motility-associated-like protein